MEKRSIEETLTYQVIDKNIAKFTKQGYAVNATGMSMPDKLNWIYIEYKINKKVYAEEAQALLFEIAQDLTQSANANKELKRYLERDSFSIEDAHIAIQFSDNNIGYQLPPYIAFALITNGEHSLYEYDTNNNNLKELNED